MSYHADNLARIHALIAKLDLSTVTPEEYLRAVHSCHPEACDEEINWVIAFNRMTPEDQCTLYRDNHEGYHTPESMELALAAIRNA